MSNHLTFNFFLISGPKDDTDDGDGDYARLRELPISIIKRQSQEDIYLNASKFNKVIISQTNV